MKTLLHPVSCEESGLCTQLPGVCRLAAFCHFGHCSQVEELNVWHPLRVWCGGYSLITGYFLSVAFFYFYLAYSFSFHWPGWRTKELLDSPIIETKKCYCETVVTRELFELIGNADVICFLSLIQLWLFLTTIKIWNLQHCFYQLCAYYSGDHI